jgi:hypothetical protein
VVRLTEVFRQAAASRIIINAHRIVFQEPPRSFSRERSVAQAVRDGGGALHQGKGCRGEAFAVDASMIVADAHRCRAVAKVEDLDPTSGRGVAEYLSVLDDTAFGGAPLVKPEAISPTDPAARYTAAANSAAVHAYSDNSLVALKHAVIMDVEATTCILSGDRC